MSLPVMAFALTNCTPSAKQLKEAVEKDPSIVFVAIEKDPEKFIEVVNGAAQNAQRKAQEKAMAEEGQKRDDEFKNPLKAEIDETRVIFGKKDAPVTIVEYSDFECPYCSRGFMTIKQVEKEYADKVRIVFKHLPLDFHPKALPAAKYFEALARQGHDKAEKFHDAMFENQNRLKSEGEKYMNEVAKKLGADMKKLEKDLKDESIMKRIEADMAEAQKFNISGTPGFIINGVSLRGAYPFPEFKTIIDRHLGGAAPAADAEKKTE
ncbi:MAG: thioredoxin domain-containing protein [Bdellovibrionaceae bacterium]|nr:thioredoxin domain-containing protein [Pseudobdellovibrionaceae bacterium]MBX3034844.1 thioredoxin domain-containing protein [Pseudobdellovibrionaceae bacterium]